MTYEKWSSIFDELPLLDEGRWQASPIEITINVDELLSIENDEDFISYIVKGFAPPKTSYRSYLAEKELLMNLKAKVRMEDNKTRRFDRNDVMAVFKSLSNNFNIFEQFRFNLCNNLTPKDKILVEVV